MKFGGTGVGVHLEKEWGKSVRMIWNSQEIRFLRTLDEDYVSHPQ